MARANPPIAAGERFHSERKVRARRRRHWCRVHRDHASAASSTIVSGENPPLAAEQLNIDSATFNVEIASTTLEQTRGLSFRPSLGASDGMLFIFGTGSVQSFWMKDMNFPLDMIWISGNTVAGFAQNVPAPAPGTRSGNLPVYTSPPNTDKVLEVNAGTVAKYNIKAGDAVTIGAENKNAFVGYSNPLPALGFRRFSLYNRGNGHPAKNKNKFNNF